VKAGGGRGGCRAALLPLPLGLQRQAAHSLRHCFAGRWRRGSWRWLAVPGFQRRRAQRQDDGHFGRPAPAFVDAADVADGLAALCRRRVELSFE